MAGHECYHCKQWVEQGEAHDCWTTTEHALTRNLSEDLQDAYARLRETAVDFGDQRIYASHNSIMFARKACYFFVRPKLSFLEVCLFLGRLVTAPQIKTTTRTSKVKIAHVVKVRHRDEVEPPLTDWLREAYQLQDATAHASSKPSRTASSKPEKKPANNPVNKPAKTPANKPTKKATKKRTKKPARKSATKPANKPATTPKQKGSTRQTSTTRRRSAKRAARGAPRRS